MNRRHELVNDVSVTPTALNAHPPRTVWVSVQLPHQVNHSHTQKEQKPQENSFLNCLKAIWIVPSIAWAGTLSIAYPCWNNRTRWFAGVVSLIDKIRPFYVVVGLYHCLSAVRANHAILKHFTSVYTSVSQRGCITPISDDSQDRRCASVYIVSQRLLCD